MGFFPTWSVKHNKSYHLNDPRYYIFTILNITNTTLLLIFSPSQDIFESVLFCLVKAENILSVEYNIIILITDTVLL